MAQYKVPQDVEAEDKLLGPFSFRQCVYLLIAGGLVALAVGLFQIFPLLVIIPLPPVVLLVALALPLKKDQPMETYLAAIVSYYLKPHTRLWKPGQRESTIKIIAPKIVEESRTRDITGEEATHRLSFLADIVDTKGYAIKNRSNGLMRDDLVAEANAAVDMFENNHFDRLASTIQKDEAERHEEVMREMREAIDKSENETAEISLPESLMSQEDIQKSPVVVLPDDETKELVEKSDKKAREVEKVAETLPKPSIIELANNDAFSVQTIEKQANRINRKDDEVFISLH